MTIATPVSPSWRLLIQAMRWHSLTGWWLLFCPCLWGWLALPRYSWRTIAWCAIGSFWARSLGCVYNDWVDRDLDAGVPRTCRRPLVNHTPTATQWSSFLGLALFSGGIFIWCLPLSCTFLAFGGALGTLLYPWLKRITHYPQVWLAIIFNSGVWMPALIQEVAFPQSLLGLYAYGILWTISYDTLYALQDEPWDRRLGIGSLAVLIGVRKAPYLLSGLMVARICLLSLTVTSWTQSAVYAGIQLFVLFHLCQRLTCSRTLHRSFHWWASAEGVMVALCIGLNAM